MTTMTFDTHKYIMTLKAAGFEEKQAEALAETQTDFMEQIQESAIKSLATKADMEATKADLKLAISELKAETIKWMFGVATGQAMFIIAILKMFPSH